VLLGEHNFEIRIGSKGWVSEAWAGVGWGWEWGLCKVPPPSSMPRASNPVCAGSPLWPVAPPPVYVCQRTFIFLISFWGNGSGPQSLLCMAGGFGCTLALYVQASPLCPGASIPVHACTCFPSSPCGGRVRVCVWLSGSPMSVLTPARSAPQATVSCGCAFASAGAQQPM
jgi:hypothetical protein